MLNEKPLESLCWMSVEILGGRERKWPGVLGIEKMGVEWFCHFKWSNELPKWITTQLIK